MMKLWMYKIRMMQLHMHKKNNDLSCKCTMLLRMYKKRMLKNKLQKGAVKLKYVPAKEQVADVLTKPLARVKFEYF